MCKLLILTKTDKIKSLKKASEVIGNALLKDQRDGFGYAVLGQRGVFGERTTKAHFKSAIGAESFAGPADIIKETRNLFGTPSGGGGGGIFHGRTSTNDKTLINTHPINKADWTLIHNGVVNNHGAKYEQSTTNDTEHLVHYLSTTGMKGIEENITGYYAIGAIAPDGTLHVIKDSVASLVVATNKTLDCLMFATTEELIKSVSKSLGWKYGPIEEVKNNIHMAFSPDGTLLYVNEFKPRGYTAYESDYAERSLGYDLSDKYGDVYEMSKYTEDYNDSATQYEDEVARMDASYEIYDWNQRSLTIAEFQRLDIKSKYDCTVIRSDGTVVDAHDYYTEKLA